MIFAGELREILNFGTPTRVQKSSGGHTVTYADYLTTYGKVVEERSKPYENEGRQVVETFVKMLIRYRPDVAIKNGDRMQWRGFDYIVDNIKVDPLRTKIEIMVNGNMGTAYRGEVAP